MINVTKKILFSLLGIVLLISASQSHATEFKTGFGLNAGNANSIGVAGAKNGSNTGTGANGDQSLIQTIKNGINVVLGFMSLISLIILLWGGFQMVTANGDDGKFKTGTKLLRQTAIGLLFIATAWMMVSMIFWIITKVGAAPPQS